MMLEIQMWLDLTDLQDEENTKKLECSFPKIFIYHLG